MAASHNRPKVDFRASMKPVTPGWLNFPLASRRTAHRPAAPQSPHITPGTAKFLSTHHKRVFPLNFSGPNSPLDSYRAGSTEEKEEGFPEPQAETPRKVHVKRLRQPLSLTASLQSDASPRADLPRIAVASVLETRGQARSSSDYQDYVIGGNSYNSHLADERLYHPRIIRISSRSKFRLYSLSEATPRYISTASNVKSLPAKTANARSTAQQNAVGRQRDPQTSFDGITYALPALSFADKMNRIKYIVDNTLPAN